MDWKNRRTLVTGGASFIGSNLVCREPQVKSMEGLHRTIDLRCDAKEGRGVCEARNDAHGTIAQNTS